MVSDQRDRVLRMPASAQVGPQIVESLVEVGSGEELIERVEDVSDGFAGVTQSAQFGAEDGGIEQGGFDMPGGGERRWVVDRCPAYRVDDPGPESDAGTVSLPDPPNAHHESQAPRGSVGLIGMGHDARIAQRRPFDGVLTGKRRSQQRHSRLR